MMERYEVIITVWLDAESPQDAVLIVENLVSIDQSLDDNDIDFSLSSAALA